MLDLAIPVYLVLLLFLGGALFGYGLCWFLGLLDYYRIRESRQQRLNRTAGQ